MLSRIALSRVLMPRVAQNTVILRCSSSKSAQQPIVPPGREILVCEEGPERDLINFPRLKMPIYPGKTRMGFIPDEWFTAFYSKTGVTGPYLFGTGVVTYLYSKEWMIMDHEFHIGLNIIIMTYVATKLFGKQLADFANKGIEEDLERLNAGERAEKKALEDAIKGEELARMQNMGTWEHLYDAKKENVGLQLEAEFRKRQMEVYTEVKKRLDYQLEVINIQRRLQQKHMVDWIVSNVLKSISAQQEKEMLSKCILDLKGLAAKA